MKLPEHLRTIRAYAAAICGDHMPKDGRWPCRACAGRGTTYPGGTREYHVAIPPGTCLFCDGSKTGRRSDWVIARAAAVVAYKQGLEDKVERALAKLSRADMDALRTYGWSAK